MRLTNFLGFSFQAGNFAITQKTNRLLFAISIEIDNDLLFFLSLFFLLQYLFLFANDLFDDLLCVLGVDWFFICRNKKKLNCLKLDP